MPEMGNNNKELDAFQHIITGNTEKVYFKRQ